MQLSFIFASLHLNPLLCISYCFTASYGNNDNHNYYLYIMKKKNKIVKVIFQVNLEEDVIAWEKHVDEILNGVESGEKSVFKVYMKNLMPIKEMDNVVRELCDALDYRFKTLSKYYSSNECIAAGYTEMLASATYYIDI